MDILSPETIQKAENFEVFNKDGNKVKFSTLYADQETLVIFIRHFLCGNCMEYTSVLSSKIDPSELAAKGMKCVIIGCGHYSLIEDYLKITNSKYPIYADPDRNIYKTFSLVRSLEWGGKPDYMSFGIMGGISRGIWRALKMGSKAFKSGDKKQDGGEFLLGPGNKCTWGHRMKNTTDHTELPELRKAIKLDEESAPEAVSAPKSEGEPAPEPVSVPRSDEEGTPEPVPEPKSVEPPIEAPAGSVAA